MVLDCGFEISRSSCKETFGRVQRTVRRWQNSNSSLHHPSDSAITRCECYGLEAFDEHAMDKDAGFWHVRCITPSPDPSLRAICCSLDRSLNTASSQGLAGSFGRDSLLDGAAHRPQWKGYSANEAGAGPKIMSHLQSHSDTTVATRLRQPISRCGNPTASTISPSAENERISSKASCDARRISSPRQSPSGPQEDQCGASMGSFQGFELAPMERKQVRS